MSAALACETVWYEKWRCDDAEREHYTRLGGGVPQTGGSPVKTAPQSDSSASSIVEQIAQARKQIQKSLQSNASAKSSPAAGPPCSQIAARIQSLENENKELRKVTQDLQALVKKLDSRVSALEGSSGTSGAPPAKVAAPPAADSGDADEDFELFGDEDDDEVDEAAEKLKAERVAAYQAKLATKKVVIAKSNIILDVKPWDDETDMVALEKCVRSIEMDGLLWGASKLVPVGYGIKKLQISCVVEDDKVSMDDVEEQILAHEDFIQSMDIVVFNKI
ncbi:hypothetical protein NP493_1197g00015 [Ridgeia piscesae]|uniref:Translation elongation factor EF1B beta/delta subunit guanine nucleotide exchange domain-containing protein n=1 Tax=Ridgeia piscesae TaxID=27915 RepID=A0AAD9KF04_RIDPI|nr:hypothetical protein NP493_1197g00015 [Ridgeia piscesae]